MTLRWPKISGPGSGAILQANRLVGPGWPKHLSGPGSGDITKRKSNGLNNQKRSAPLTP